MIASVIGAVTSSVIGAVIGSVIGAVIGAMLGAVEGAPTKVVLAENDSPTLLSWIIGM